MRVIGELLCGKLRGLYIVKEKIKVDVSEGRVSGIKVGDVVHT